MTCIQYLAVSQYSNDRDTQGFDMLFESRTHGCRQLLQHGQGLLDLKDTEKTFIFMIGNDGN